MTKLAHLIATLEGFYVKGSKPQRDNNPGDLEHAPHIVAFDGKIGVEDTVEHGWADLDRQISLDAQRGLTLRQFVAKYAPPTENNTNNYLAFVSKGLALPPDTPLSECLKIPAAT